MKAGRARGRAAHHWMYDFDGLSAFGRLWTVGRPLCRLCRCCPVADAPTLPTAPIRSPFCPLLRPCPPAMSTLPRATRRCSMLPVSPGVARGRPSCHVPGDGGGAPCVVSRWKLQFPSRARKEAEIRDFTIIPQPKFSHLSHIGSMQLHGSAVGWPSHPI